MRRLTLIVCLALLGLWVAGCAGKGGRQPPSVGALVWAPPRSRPLSDARAAALVVPRPERRPENQAANDYVPTAAQLKSFHRAADPSNPLDRYVDGRDGLTNPSTDDLIQWGAHKWGIPLELLRAQLSLESELHMNRPGDRRTVSASWYAQYPVQARIPGTHEVYESMGVGQIKWKPDGSQGAGTEPLRWQSTAFNIDYQAAATRYYYDGYCHWCGSGYGAGQEWNSIGAWFSPHPWANPGARAYVRHVLRFLRERAWEQRSF